MEDEEEASVHTRRRALNFKICKIIETTLKISLHSKVIILKKSNDN
jgi:hypothetical protein